MSTLEGSQGPGLKDPSKQMQEAERLAWELHRQLNGFRRTRGSAQPDPLARVTQSNKRGNSTTHSEQSSGKANASRPGSEGEPPSKNNSKQEGQHIKQAGKQRRDKADVPDRPTKLAKRTSPNATQDRASNQGPGTHSTAQDRPFPHPPDKSSEPGTAPKAPRPPQSSPSEQRKPQQHQQHSLAATQSPPAGPVPAAHTSPNGIPNGRTQKHQQQQQQHTENHKVMDHAHKQQTSHREYQQPQVQAVPHDNDNALALMKQPINGAIVPQHQVDAISLTPLEEAALLASSLTRAKLKQAVAAVRKVTGGRTIKVFHCGMRWGVTLPEDRLKRRCDLAAALNECYAGQILSCGRGEMLHVLFMDSDGGAAEFPALRSDSQESPAAWKACVDKAVRVYVMR